MSHDATRQSCKTDGIEFRTTSKYAVHLLAPNHQLYHYEECSVYPRRKRAKLPREALDGEKVATIRSDLESIGVTICSVEVRSAFSAHIPILMPSTGSTTLH